MTKGLARTPEGKETLGGEADVFIGDIKDHRRKLPLIYIYFFNIRFDRSKDLKHSLKALRKVYT